MNEHRRKAGIALGRVRAGRPTKGVVLVGPLGGGRTALLLRMRDDAEARGLLSLQVDASESRSLPTMLARGMRRVLARLAKRSKAREPSLRAFRALAGFAGAHNGEKRGNFEIGLDLDPGPGLADSGVLEFDLQDLMMVVGDACRRAETGLVMIVDELQHVAEGELAALVSALHRAAQRQLPVLLLAAGPPLLRGRIGRVKPYAERLFDFLAVGPPAAPRF